MTDDNDIDGLAAEYVLGALTPLQRSAVASRSLRDKVLAEAITHWERRLTPLSLREPGLAPPPRALDNVLVAIGGQAQLSRHADATRELRSRVRRWQLASGSLAAASVCLAIALGGVGDRASGAGSGAMIAVLAGSSAASADEPLGGSAPLFFVTIDARTGELTLRQPAGRRPPAERSYSLWLQPHEPATPIAIGAIRWDGDVARLTLTGEQRRALVSGTILVRLDGPDGQPFNGRPAFASGKLEPAIR